MAIDDEGRPLCGTKRMRLGARPGNPATRQRADLEVRAGRVGPGTGGMSCHVGEKIPKALSPEALDDPDGHKVFAIESDNLGSRLIVVGPNPKGHAVVEPVEEMSFEDYLGLLCATRDYWEAV